MPRVDRAGRVEDDDRLDGVWLRPDPTEYRWYAPVRLVGGAFGLCWVEVRYAPDRAHRRTHWAVVTRDGHALGGDFDLPAVTYRQALAAVERALTEAGIALDGRGG